MKVLQKEKCICKFFFLLLIIGIILESIFTLLIKNVNIKFGVFLCVSPQSAVLIQSIHKADKKTFVNFISIYVLYAKILTRTYQHQVINRNSRKRLKTCSNLTTKTPECRHRSCSCVFIVNFEHISNHFSLFLLLTLKRKIFAGICHMFLCFRFGL